MNSGLPPVRWASTSTSPSGGGAAGKRACEVGRDRVGGQPRQRRAPRTARARRGRGRARRRAARRPARSRRYVPSTSSRAGIAAAQERREQVERRVVGPVQVLEHEHERRRGAERVERLEHLAQHPRARRALRGVADRLGPGPGLVEQPRQLDQPGRRALRERADDRVALRTARQLAERLQHRHVGLARPAVARGTGRRRQRSAPASAGTRRRACSSRRPARRASSPRRGAGPRARRAPRAAARARLARPTGAGGARRSATPATARRRAPSAGSCSRIRRSSARVALAGRQPELAQPRGEVAVGRERLDLAARAVEREHQRADELLAQRVGRDQPAQLGHRLQRPAELDERAGAPLLGLRAQVLEPADLGLRELRVGRDRRTAARARARARSS